MDVYTTGIQTRTVNIIDKLMLGPQSLTEEATNMQDCTMLFRPSLSSTALSLQWVYTCSKFSILLCYMQ